MLKPLMDRTPPFPAENMKGRVSKEQTTGDPLRTDFQKNYLEWAGKKTTENADQKIKATIH